MRNILCEQVSILNIHMCINKEDIININGILYMKVLNKIPAVRNF